MANLVELFDNIVQMQNLNGVPLANGKMYVYALGRTRLMDTWSDVDGVSLNSNPIILDAAGQCHCYVSDDFDYTLVVTDAYDNEIFSIDKYLYSQGSHSHADVAVAPSETIAVSSYHVGETTVYVPYLTGQLGKVYTGIDPIIVNNTEDKISANHVPLGVQDPLYFVKDDEEGCIIGFSGQTVPEGVMTESALGFENNKITGYNGSAFSAGNEYEAGSYISITDNTISVTGLQPEGDYAYNSALSSKLDVTATGQFLTGLPEDLMYSGDMTAYQPAGDYQTAGNYQTAGDYLSASDSANFLLTGDSANFLLTSDSGNFYPMESNPSGYLTAHQSLAGYATEQWVENKGYLTGIDIPESANWNSTYNTVHDNSASWTGGSTPNPQISVTGINGIKISESGDQVVFEVSGDYATQDWVTAQGYLTAHQDISNLMPKSESANFYPMTGNPSGFLTDDNTVVLEYGTSTWAEFKAAYDAHKNIVMYQRDIGDITNTYATFGYVDFDGEPYAASFTTVCYGTEYRFTLNSNNVWQSYTQMYQGRGNYYSASNPSGFITGVDLTPYQTTAGMTAYMSTADSANFYTTANESGFVTSGELPDPITIGVQEGDTLDTDYDGLKIVKSTANGNEHINLHKKSTDQWLIHGNLVPTSPGSNKYLVTDDSGAMHWDNKSALAYDSAFEQSGGYITAYNGSAFKAGDELPSGVMNESALEYNAVNEISGYNGSAIAQYGAEKQWLQHDDTIVHVANSAQYAFGVNVSALQRLMGIDETVLWEGTAMITTSKNAINLSESMYNFNSIKIYDRSFSNNTNDAFATTVTEVSMLPSAQEIGTSDTWMDFYMPTTSGSHYFGRNYYSGNADGTKLVTLGSYIKPVNSTSAYSYRGAGKIFKIVGIGRKS